MSASRWLACAVLSAFCVLQASSLDSFVAAVYEHAVILPSGTLLPVSHSEALALMNRNLDLLEGAIVAAAKQVSSPISPEGASSPERDGGVGECVGVSGRGGGGSQGTGLLSGSVILTILAKPTFFVLLEHDHFKTIIYT